MPIAGYAPLRRTVDLPGGGSFEVRAISLPDVGSLIRTHHAAVDQIVAIIGAKVELGLDEDTLTVEIVKEVATEFPSVAADLICLCADEPDEFRTVLRMPLTVQFAALMAIFELSFEDIAAVKKLAADVMTMIRRVLPTPIPALAAE